MKDRIKVMMVDDEPQFRETTSKILVRKGYETTVAASGDEAIRIIQKKPQDVVVLDIKMPGMDGHQVLEEIKKVSPQTQVIMLTGHGGLDSAINSHEHGAFDYLSKPCDIDRLAARIHDAYAMTHKDKPREKKASDVMIPVEDYTIITPDKSIQEGIEALAQSFQNLLATDKLMKTGHRSLLVMSGPQELLGVLSIRDLIRALMPSYLSAPKPSTADSMEFSPMFWSGLFTRQAKSLAGKRVEEIMSPPPPSIDDDANLMEVAHLLFSRRARRLVVTGRGNVIGVVREQEIFFELSRIMLER